MLPRGLCVKTGQLKPPSRSPIVVSKEVLVRNRLYQMTEILKLQNSGCDQWRYLPASGSGKTITPFSDSVSLTSESGLSLGAKDRPGSLFQPGPGPGPGSAKSAGTGILRDRDRD